MKRKISILLVSTLLISCLVACVSGDSAEQRFQKQINLGKQYLSAMDYENAIISYRAAIEIDPKNAEAYIGLAEVYKSNGDYRQEWEVLLEGSEQTQDARITAMIEEAKQLMVASTETTESTEESSSTVETKESTEASTEPTEESTDPTEESSVEPTTESTPEPTSTPEPMATPTPKPTEEPTTESTPEPTVQPTVEPTAQPTVQPTATPTPAYSTAFESYLTDGIFSDSECNAYATKLGATGYIMKSDAIAFVFNSGEYVLILGTSADPGGIYIATAYFNNSGSLVFTYYCEVGASSNSKIQIYSDGTYCTTDEVIYFEKLVSYMASHPDPNVMPSLDNAEWWPW